MTDPYAATPAADDIDDTLDTESSRLSRQADSILDRAEGRSFEPSASLRQSLRDDVDHSRAWAAERAERVRSAIQEEPLHYTAYALGIGLLVGLLLRR